MDKEFQLLNTVYQPVYEYTKSLLNDLKSQGYDVKWGFYNNHSIMMDHTWVTEYYPIPVITVKNICDIGLDMNHTFIEFKMKREKAIDFTWDLISEYTFEVYGVENYLNDFYNKSLRIDTISSKIKESDEKEIGIAFYFNYLEDKDTLLSVIKTLKEMETYIL